MPKLDLSQPVSTFRTDKLRAAAAPPVQIDGGKFGAGLLSDVAVITRGEALGHGNWIDAEFLQSVATAINYTGSNGVKARYTHPDDSGDGLGSLLGRVTDAYVDGDTVRADLHLASSAHSTPDGNLAAYIMDLATEDPDAFGLSIAFQRDIAAEEQFMLDNGGERGRFGFDDSRFASPDADNELNLPHVRLKELRAVDAVDEPAANPNGLFRSKSIAPNEADALLAYATGRSADRPTLTCFDVDPDRVTNFLSRWLDRNGLAITSKPTEHSAMSKDTATPPADTQLASQPANKSTPAEPAVSRSELLSEVRQELAKFTGRFGAQNGAAWFNEGKSYAEALELHADALAAQLSAKDETIAELNTKLAAFKDLGVDPVDQTPQPGDQKKTGLGAVFSAGALEKSAAN